MESAKCSFYLGPESRFAKFRMGGNPEGTAEIYDNRIEVFKKSTFLTLAFGAIGSALSGKGKPEAIVTRDMVIAYRETGKRTFFLYLQNGNMLYVNFIGISVQNAGVAMMNFLKDKPIK